MRHRRQEALRNLNKLRPKRDADDKLTDAEVDAIEASFEESGGHDAGRWIDLLRGNMLRRTWIACTLFVFLQFCGVQFVNR